MEKLLVVVGLVLAVVALAWIAISSPQKGGKSKGGDDEVGFVTTESGLKYKDEVVGRGREAKPGDAVSVHYTGTLTDGTKFDSSRDRGQPFVFSIGGKVIKGWNEGVVGMKVGGKRSLIIPPDLGYGEMGSPPTIPPNAVLHFDIELLKVGAH